MDPVVEPVVSRTAMYVALYRALEYAERSRPRLFVDPFAERFVSPRLRAALRAAQVPRLHRWFARVADQRAPGARTSAIARTAYIDDAVCAAIERGVRQVVVLGAGFDCRAHRLPELGRATVFEVDRAPTQERKRAQLPLSTVRYIAVDFLRDDTFACLAAAGWQRDAATVFVWEGVTNYLRADAVARVLAEIGRCAVGSAIVFTYVHQDVLDHPARFVGGERAVANVQRLGEPWTFGLLPGDVAAVVGRAGLTLRDDLGADDYRTRYLGATDPGYAFYRIAVAERPPLR